VLRPLFSLGGSNIKLKLYGTKQNQAQPKQSNQPTTKSIKSMAYVIPSVYADGEAVRDQILEDILMGDGLAASANADLAAGRWDAASGIPQCGGGVIGGRAQYWLNVNGFAKKDYRAASGRDAGQVAEPKHFEDIRSWAKWEIQVLGSARKEFILNKSWEGLTLHERVVGICGGQEPSEVNHNRRIGWTRITTNLYKKVGVQEQLIDELKNQTVAQEQSISELQNHAIVQQQQIDELRSVVEALAHSAILQGYGTDKCVQSFIEAAQEEDHRVAAEEEARLAEIALKVAKEKVAAEKVAAEEARAKKKAEIVSKMAARAKARLAAIDAAERELEERTKKEMSLLHAKRTYAAAESEESYDSDDSDDSDELLLVQQEVEHGLAALQAAALQAAEARVAATKQRGIQKGKRTGSTALATWSVEKCERMSAGWCE
jgi:hypothetical protein